MTRSAAVRVRSDRCLPSDAGVATIPAAVAMTVLIALTGVLVHLGAAAIARHRAEAAADLGALAGAAKVLDGAAAACSAASALVARNGARLVECDLQGWDVVVRAEAAAAVGVLSATVVGRARAGPVTAP
ncbi:Rv3654c family TadE-like protein [Nakamurella endophytica]|uniref:Putative Flp pilus-assembly TadG-like N-terminal domain-containing protein n=1 Tax=Nakamurella endophytica TaxID=1748367 RepID=A0A917WHV2_9ACTN|nr:Rv3654c family TadE-like protein [Nakamurella endophytica]GGM05321.1 hypothetical protein GCM10011594_26930 [Nakamurella endophytica]